MLARFSMLAVALMTAAIVVGCICGVEPDRCKDKKASTTMAPTPAISRCTVSDGPMFATTAEQNLTFTFTNLPNTMSMVRLLISYRGDFDRGEPNDEAVTIIGEASTKIGTTASITTCSFLESEEFSIALATFNEWNEDLSLDLTVVLGSGVDFGCTYENLTGGVVAEITLTLTYDAHGGC